MNKKENVFQCMTWKFLERLGAQLVTLGVSVILARLLSPEDYGLISIVTVLITIANVFVADGFGSALIQKKKVDAVDYSSVLYANLLFSALLYVVLFISAPAISAFYGEGYELLTPIIRILGIRVILAGANSVQQAYISRNMLFRLSFYSSMIGTVISAVVGIWMACSGYGVWAIVAQYLVNTTISTFVLVILIKKKLLLQISLARLKELLQYGIKILGANLLITGYQEVRSLIIGKMYSASDLAYYDRGKQFPSLVVTNINESIGAVLFPRMSVQQDDIDKLRASTCSSIRFSTYIMAPLMLGLAAVAEPFVSFLLTDKWLPCIPFLRVFCVIYLFQPIHTANMQAIKALGRSDVYLKLEIIKKGIELITLLIVMWISVEAIVISMAVLTTVFTVINAYPNKKLLNYTLAEQIKDILPTLVMAGFMAICVYYVGLIQIGLMSKLILQIVSGVVIYVSLSYATKNEQFIYLVGIGKQLLSSRLRRLR